MQLRSLSGEDPLEEGMATHSVFLPGEFPWTEEPGRLQSMGLQRVRHDGVTKHAQEVYEKGRGGISLTSNLSTFFL